MRSAKNEGARTRLEGWLRRGAANSTKRGKMMRRLPPLVGCCTNKSPWKLAAHGNPRNKTPQPTTSQATDAHPHSR